jgi:quercetin dioxygenase-like cupin family protein
MAERAFESAHISELDAIPGPGTLLWRPIRRRFGIEAFGMNAYTAERAGEDLVEDHTEETYGHQEVYFVARGHATFTVAGEAIDAPEGTLVFIRDPSVRRYAVAREDGSTVIAVGGRPGAPFKESAWEFSFAARPYVDAAITSERSRWRPRGSSVTPTTRGSSTTSAAGKRLPAGGRTRLRTFAARTSSHPRRCASGRRTTRTSTRSATSSSSFEHGRAAARRRAPLGAAS